MMRYGSISSVDKHRSNAPLINLFPQRRISRVWAVHVIDHERFIFFHGRLKLLPIEDFPAGQPQPQSKSKFTRSFSTTRGRCLTWV
jgi:hypothetical protein